MAGNVSSGSSEAESVLSAFRRVLNPVQVVDVSSVRVEEAVRLCHMLRANCATSVKLVVAGGDGTIGWVLNTLHSKKLMQVILTAGNSLVSHTK